MVGVVLDYRVEAADEVPGLRMLDLDDSGNEVSS